jgi:DNA-binding protein HU-beta
LSTANRREKLDFSVACPRNALHLAGNLASLAAFHRADSMDDRQFPLGLQPGNRRPENRQAATGEPKMNKLELVEHVAKEAELTKVSAAAALEAVLDGIAKSLKKGEEVRLVGFGTFSVRERAAGKGRNPATGKEIKIAASKNARFKAGAALKSSLNVKKAAKK